MRPVLFRLSVPLVLLSASLFAVAAAEVPAFWKSRVSDVKDVVSSVRKGQVKVETVSPGGRPVYSVIYGDMDLYKRTANFGSAALSHSPEAFARRAPDAKPVLMVLSGVHGQEMETVVGALNLIRVLETGADFRGKKWPEIADKGAKYRLVILPCCNPDGRARVPKDSFVGVPADTMTWYGQGTRADGSMYGWPTVKEYHPMVADIGFLGGYHNDQGVNLQCDDMFEPMADETRAILRLAEAEAPDCAVNVHSHEECGEFLIADWVPPKMKQRNYEIAGRYFEAMEKEGVPHHAYRRQVEESTGVWAIDLTDAIYHISGALSMTFEGPHGVTDRERWRLDYDQILDTHLIMYRELLRIGLDPGGFRGDPDVPSRNWRD
jgi:hypothetical protein